jgi:uncharacterized peroxidase-related enzyme
VTLSGRNHQEFERRTFRVPYGSSDRACPSYYPTNNEEFRMSHFQIMDEGAAEGEVAEVFDEIKRVMEIPFVPNIMKSQGLSASALKGTWGALSNVFLRTNLPMSLASMILYSIAAARNCEYCSAVHKMTCKTVGIDEDTLAALEKDLEALTPRRVQQIVKFAQKCAAAPATVTEEDYEGVRAEGVSDEEIVEIVALAALGNYLDTLADAIRVDVDDVFKAPAQA